MAQSTTDPNVMLVLPAEHLVAIVVCSLGLFMIRIGPPKDCTEAEIICMAISGGTNM